MSRRIAVSDHTPAQLVLMASVAQRYHLDRRSKVEIAEEFGLSRFKVARLLDAARNSGLVRVEIRHDGAIDIDLSSRLRERFGLQHAVVVEVVDGDPDLLRRRLAASTADLLAEIVVPQDVLGLAWARSVSVLARMLPRLPGTPVVQLTGVLNFAEATTVRSTSCGTPRVPRAGPPMSISFLLSCRMPPLRVACAGSPRSRGRSVSCRP